MGYKDMSDEAMARLAQTRRIELGDRGQQEMLAELVASRNGWFDGLICSRMADVEAEAWVAAAR